jgi:inorganic pyrophosphatase
MIDNGRYDEKIIAIPFNDPNYNQYKSIDQLPKHIFDEMTHFFKVYKNLENKETVVDDVHGREEAVKIISVAVDSYIDNFCK